MNYEWDPAKARTNHRKHGIDFADAVMVFSDDYALTIDDDHPEEDRLVTIGIDALGRLLVVVFTWRGQTIRIISARKAESYERKQYEGQL
ncbi:MAG TPA: BrnT family toxin [Anaerolineae bacterium]|nr:BrnT family toxin [Anaerolineae bacterium]